MNWSDMSPRERDALVAEKVMDIEVFRYLSEPIVVENKWVGPPKRYTTDISAAWEVQEKVGDWPVQERDRYVDELVAEVAGTAVLDHPDDRWDAINATPEQRCLAALRAKGVDV